MSESFGARLGARMRKLGAVCVGIDPHVSQLETWDLPDSAEGAYRFGMTVLDEVGELAAAVKPQSAFFERHGSAGIAALERILEAARVDGVPVILDVKRGDIGSTMAAYADAYLSPGAPLEADAITLSPYLGVGSLVPAFEMAQSAGKGVFVLGLTSNEDGPQFQHARTLRGNSVAAEVVADLAPYNQVEGMGSFGLVVGATVGDAVRTQGVDLVGVNGPLLAPGIGAQGAGAKEIESVFGDARDLVLASASRSITGGGGTKVRERFKSTLEAVRGALGQ